MFLTEDPEMIKTKLVWRHFLHKHKKFTRNSSGRFDLGVVCWIQIEYLNSLFEACSQKREEDSGDGYMVSWLGEACVFPAGVHSHAPGNITNWHLVTLQDGINGSEKSQRNMTMKFMAAVSERFLGHGSLHVPEYAAPGTWQIWSLWSAGRVGLQIC